MNAQVSFGPTKVYQAIAAITGELARVGISKGRKNAQQGYAFRGIDDVYSALSGLLAQYKLCVIPRVIHRSVTEQTSKSGGVLFYTVVDVEFDLVSAEDGSRHTARLCGEAMDSGDKATNKAMSAAYKYFALQTFCIPTEGDNDADAQTHEVAARQHNPRGELGHGDPEAYQEMAKRMRVVLDADVDEDVKAMRVMDLHDSLRVQHDIYVGASDCLSSKERSAWKAYIGLAKKRMDAEPSYNGR